MDLALSGSFGRLKLRLSDNGRSDRLRVTVSDAMRTVKVSSYAVVTLCRVYEIQRRQR